MKVILIILATILFVQAVPLICNQTGALTNLEVDALVGRINKESFSEGRVDQVRKFVANNSRGFTGPQTVKVLSAIPLSDYMGQAIDIMNPRILQMTIEEIINVLKALFNSDQRILVLPSIMNLATDPENNDTIVDLFSFSTDKQKARDILKNMKPRSCVFGTVKEPRVTFAIDVSPSMAATFRDNTGKSWTRIDFVKNELDSVVTKQLAVGQEFNLAVFGGNVVQWSVGLVKVNETTKASSLIWLKRQQYIGGTNIYSAIERSYSVSRVAAVYLLSDGMPTEGVRDINQILNRAQQLCKQGATTIPLHTIAFLSGFFNGDDKPGSRKLMQALAERCGGTYRAIE